MAKTLSCRSDVGFQTESKPVAFAKQCKSPDLNYLFELLEFLKLFELLEFLKLFELLEFLKLFELLEFLKLLK